MSSAPAQSFGRRPGALHRSARRALQAVSLIAVLVSPFLGGFQRNDRSEMAAWEATGFDLPRGLRTALPAGSSARRAHDLNLLEGGGIASEYLGIAVMDPLAGALALLHGGIDGRVLVAWGLPVLLGLLFGRAFCGWSCPYGTVARGLDRALSLLPIYRRIALPPRRPLRFVLVALCVVAGVFGAHLVLYLMLPYVLLQHAVYAGWLLGGGSAVLGLFCGLLLAGVLFGPATYCATLCPTGAVLSLLGRARRVHLTIEQPKQCGTKCALCSRSCWLQLDPASGDPGPDCDLCARCVPVCPRTNLVLTTREPRRKLPLVVGVLVCGALSLAPSAHADRGAKPRLVLDAERTRADSTLAVSVIDLTGVELAEGGAPSQGIELSVFLRRGALAASDARAGLAEGGLYQGPLTVEVERSGRVTRVPFDAPNSPQSTLRRAIYRVRLPYRLVPGDSVRVLAVQGYWDRDEPFPILPRGTRPALPAGLGFMLAGLLGFGGLLSLSLAVR